jgi:hypothetical protein
LSFRRSRRSPRRLCTRSRPGRSLGRSSCTHRCCSCGSLMGSLCTGCSRRSSLACTSCTSAGCRTKHRLRDTDCRFLSSGSYPLHSLCTHHRRRPCMKMGSRCSTDCRRKDRRYSCRKSHRLSMSHNLLSKLCRTNRPCRTRYSMRHRRHYGSWCRDQDTVHTVRP